jgi:hypothetical protein
MDVIRTHTPVTHTPSFPPTHPSASHTHTPLLHTHPRLPHFTPRGYNIGQKLIDEFLAKSGVGNCQNFRDVGEVIAKVGGWACVCVRVCVCV